MDVTRNRKRMANLGALAASLLVLTPVMKGAVAEAFLGSLTATQKYQASNKDVLAAYSKWYGLLLAAGYESWQDYLLDQLLLGRDNALARTIAQGGLDDGAPILKALAHDLDVLQTLSVSLADVAEFVGESVPFAGAEWVTAASSTSFRRPGRRLGSGAPPRVEALNLDTKTKYITRPPTPDELTAWKDAITSKELWSQAAPVVCNYWQRHGFGITSRNAALRWVKGALDEAPDALAKTGGAVPATAPTAAVAAGLGPLAALERARTALADNTARHARGSGAPASHALIFGPSGTGKTWLAWDSTLAAGRELGVRVVDLGSGDGSTILEAARGCGRYPRVRFVLVADPLELPLRGAAGADLLAGLTQGGAAGWPSNTLLYAVASSTSTIQATDPLVSRFGLKLGCQPLEEDSFKATVQELTARRFPGQGEVPLDVLSDALDWARSGAGGGLTIRSATMYIDRLTQ